MVRPGSTYGKHLYLLRMGDLVKVGRSMDIQRRLGEHRRNNPWGEISLVATFEDSGFVESWVLKALPGDSHVCLHDMRGVRDIRRGKNELKTSFPSSLQGKNHQQTSFPLNCCDR